jgi:hypothetical protein
MVTKMAAPAAGITSMFQQKGREKCTVRALCIHFMRQAKEPSQLISSYVSFSRTVLPFIAKYKE